MTHAETDQPAPQKAISAAARRALAEAASRRTDYKVAEAAMPPERGGRSGMEPVRYGDWEVKGLATDF